MILYLYLLTVSAVLAAAGANAADDSCATTPTTTTTTSEPDPPCNCDDLCGVIGLSKRDDDAEGLLREDSDEDGDPTICAGNREMRRRTFHSVCHMMCHNDCTTYRVFKMTRDDGKRVSYVASYRNNFYKLHDGAC